VKKINNALDIETRQYRKLISTTAKFCTIKTTAMLERTSTNRSFKFIIHSSQTDGLDSNSMGSVTCPYFI
jgi:hypothetical protein